MEPGLVTGVSQATKEELMRIVGAEVRGFLDKMDIAESGPADHRRA